MPVRVFSKDKVLRNIAPNIKTVDPHRRGPVSELFSALIQRETPLIFIWPMPLLKAIDWKGHEFGAKKKAELGSQHPSPSVKNLCNFETQIWLEIITARDAKSACFKGSQTSCTEVISGFFLPNFGRKRPHHVMDACC